jgi:hypothetical protein
MTPVIGLGDASSSLFCKLTIDINRFCIVKFLFYQAIVSGILLQFHFTFAFAFALALMVVNYLEKLFLFYFSMNFSYKLSVITKKIL